MLLGGEIPTELEAVIKENICLQSARKVLLMAGFKALRMYHRQVAKRKTWEENSKNKEMKFAVRFTEDKDRG